MGKGERLYHYTVPPQVMEDERVVLEVGTRVVRAKNKRNRGVGVIEKVTHCKKKKKVLVKWEREERYVSSLSVYTPPASAASLSTPVPPLVSIDIDLAGKLRILAIKKHFTIHRTR